MDGKDEKRTTKITLLNQNDDLFWGKLIGKKNTITGIGWCSVLGLCINVSQFNNFAVYSKVKKKKSSPHDSALVVHIQ